MIDYERLAAEIDDGGKGPRFAFGIPGGGPTLSLIDALERRGIGFHLTHFEGAGAIMAATAGRLSGRPGLSMSIKGPGLANAFPGLAAAWFEAFPVVHVAEAYAEGSAPALAHKRLDQRAAVAPVTKAVRTYRVGYQTLADFAAAEEPGPVVLELADGSDEQLPSPAPVGGDRRAAQSMVHRAQRPTVVAGALAVRAGLGPSLAGLSIPVFTTAAAKGIIDETVAHAAGIVTGVGLELTPERQVLDQADLVVGIGLTAREMLATKPFGRPFLAIEAVQTPGTSGFQPDARAGIDAATELLALLAKKPAWGLDRLAATLDALLARVRQGFLPGAVFETIERRFDRSARIVLDTGYFCTIGEHAVRARRPDLCLMSAQGRNMGTGLPMALGAALADRTTPTVAVLGDGGTPMFLGEARLAVREKLPLLIVTMTDNAFGSIRTRAIQERLTQKPLTMDCHGFVAAFDGLGIPGTRVDSLPGVEDALGAWEPSLGPAYLEIAFNPDAYEAMVAGVR
jgi:acetolactate synthase-1/2/3 large subunit